MKYRFCLLVLVLATSPVFAGDTEIEQLRAEVKELRQLVTDLTLRVKKLEGKAVKPKPSAQKVSSLKTPIYTNFYIALNYTLKDVVPSRRLIKQHVFELKSLEAKYDKIASSYLLTFEFALQNYANETWNPNTDKFVLMLKNTDIVSHSSIGSKLEKRQRGILKVTFEIKDFEPQKVKIVIISSDPANVGNTEFRMTVSN